jgi:hypothetical protein
MHKTMRFLMKVRAVPTLLVTLMFPVMVAAEDQFASWSGPMFELRYGVAAGQYDFAVTAGDLSLGTSIADTASSRGLKIGYRWRIERFTFGPVAALYAGNRDYAVSKAATDIPLSANFRYTEGLSATLGLQAGYVLPRGNWLLYGEVGKAGQQLSLGGSVAYGDDSITAADQSYLMGDYGALGVSRQFGSGLTVSAEVSERRYQHGAEDGRVRATASRTDTIVNLAVGWQF